MAKMSLEFDGFVDLAYAIDKAEGDLKSAVDEALSGTQKLIQTNVELASEKYKSPNKGRKGYAQGDMYRSIIKAEGVKWEGTVAEVNAGFNLLEKGGFHSLFVMYGTPRMAKNSKVYNAIKGKKTRDSVEKLQVEIMQKHLRLTKGGN